MHNQLANIDGFTATQKVFGVSFTGIAIDEERKKVCLLGDRQRAGSFRIFTYKDLIASEISEDGITITKTNRTSQIGGALMGGLAIGGLGAMVGGLSGKTQTSSRVRNVELRLTVNDVTNPIHDVVFLNTEVDKSSGQGTEYDYAIKRARHWHGLITILIKQTDTEDKMSITNDRLQIRETSVADELKKLAELCDAGLLSADEFQQQKTKLLGS